MHFWPNKSIDKINTPTMGQIRGNRPKNLKDEEWNALLADELLNRQIILDCVPKVSKKQGAPKRASSED